MALPVTLPDWVQVPGARVKPATDAVPVFLIVMVVLTVWPGTIVVEPPYLLIVEQVAVLLVTLLPVPSVLRHVTVPAAFCSCMITVPAAAVLIELVIEAVNAARLDVIVRAMIATPARPVTRASSESRRRPPAFEEEGEVSEDIVLAPGHENLTTTAGPPTAAGRTL